jgi:hypothetical protein
MRHEKVYFTATWGKLLRLSEHLASLQGLRDKVRRALVSPHRPASIGTLETALVRLDSQTDG